MRTPIGISFDWDYFAKERRLVNDTDETVYYQLRRWRRSTNHPVPQPWRATVARIRSAFQNRIGRVVVADSHKYGFEHTKGIKHLLHFDAHHDLGYGVKSAVNCGNWIRHALERDSRLHVSVVYPPWRSFHEVFDGRCSTTKAAHHKRVSFFTWESFQPYLDVIAAQAGHHGARTVVLARSSAWTPPRMDAAFVEFAHAWQGTSMHVVDDEEFVHALHCR